MRRSVGVPKTQTGKNLEKLYLRLHLNLNMHLKTPQQIENAVEIFNTTIQEAAGKSMPTVTQRAENLHPTIREKLKTKRELRKRWQIRRNPANKNP